MAAHLTPRRSRWTWPVSLGGAVLVLFLLFLVPAAWWRRLLPEPRLRDVRQRAFVAHLQVVELAAVEPPPAGGAGRPGAPAAPAGPGAAPAGCGGAGVVPDLAVRADRDDAAPPPHAELIDQFLGGLRSVWRPFGEERSIQVPRGSELVGRPCPWCRHRVRAGDWVVLCPDGCGTCFHQDIFRHLTCWNTWNGPDGKRYCPSSGQPYKSDQPA